MVLFRQCVVLFLLGFLADVVQTLHIQACANKQMFLSVLTIVAIYLVGFFAHKWFIEHKTTWARWWITVAGALGAGVGTGLVIFLGDYF